VDNGTILHYTIQRACGLLPVVHTPYDDNEILE
jgi:hypothetical protein